jgi:hypothetical protein
MTQEEKLGKEARELHIRVGFRALLGDSKAQKQMMNLQGNYASYAREVMAEAQARYDALSTEEKGNPQKKLAELTVSTVKLRLIILLKIFPRAIWGLLKQLNPFAPKN